MKQLFLKLIKVFLFIALAVLIILLILGIVFRLDWPWWMGIVLAAGLAGCGAGGLFIRKIWLRRREQRFVQQIVEQDTASLQKLSAREQAQLQDLQEKWKEAIAALKRSHLKKQGNPLYVLPWYMVIGESGSGKTTALQSARLSSPFVEVNRTSGISGTRSCDWWFFEQAIVIDTAGRYSIPVDEGRDKEEWQKFLNLLAKYRRREPLNGLLITIAADKLLDARPEILEDDGTAIRRRIDELIRVLGVTFPLYVLVTKCDLIQGMTQVCDHLPEKSLDQAMGFINQDLSKDVAAVQDRAFASIGDRLREHRLLLIHQLDPKAQDPALLIFPEELERLRPGLDIFLKRIFQANPYQETPVLRGLFLSSGRQEGTPFSHFLQGLGLMAEREVLPGTSRGLFLHDLFARILPKDRGLFAPTQRSVEWSRMTRNLGLISWVALMTALCGLLSFSFVMNMKTLRQVSREFSRPAEQGAPVDGDPTGLSALDRFRQTILDVEALNRNWWVPTFGLSESRGLEAGLKDKYCQRFQKAYLTPFDEKLAAEIGAPPDGTASDQAVRGKVSYLVKRINLLKARLDGEELDALKARPQPSTAWTQGSAGKGGESPEARNIIDTLYLYYLVWNSDSGQIEQELRSQQERLQAVLTGEGSNLRWLVNWADATLPAVNRADFWGGGKAPAPDADDHASVAPAFTVKGKEQIDSFLREIEAALPDPMIMAEKKSAFEGWYHQAYMQAWYDFGLSFPHGAASLMTREERRQVATRMAAGTGPYQALLDTMARELEPLSATEQATPPWLLLIYQYQTIREQAVRQDPARQKGILDKVADQGKKLMGSSLEKLQKLEKKVGSLREMTQEARSAAARGYLEYANALAEVSPALTSASLSCQVSAQVYTEEPALGKNPFFSAQRALTKIRASAPGSDPASEMVWKLISGPVDYLWAFVDSETACYLQKQWEEEVLTEIEGICGWKKVQQLILGPDGFVQKFVKGKLEPFIIRSQGRGYCARKVLDRQIPFADSFFSFLNKGTAVVKTVEGNYAVSIRGLPTDANPEAKIKPHATRLELFCESGLQSIVNLNYPIAKTFNWSPESCGEVTFQIDVADFTLTRKYTGDHAFARFLQDFRGGERTFSAREFPEQKAMLDRLGIKYIRARYQFSGQYQSIMALQQNVPTQVPQTIVRCGEQ
ncbi:MAG: type VI secretion protein IcmF/TssM N-terminal domain-containing protein [bacterium]